MSYVPPDEILEKFAKVLVHFGLNEGEGVQPGDVVCVKVWQDALSLYPFVRREIIDAGAHSFMRFVPKGTSRYFYEHASDEQLSWFPDQYIRGYVDQMDHLLNLRCVAEPRALEGIDPKKPQIRNKAWKPAMDWRKQKEHEGNLTWCLTSIPCQDVADEAGMSLEEYWTEVIMINRLGLDDPVAWWKQFQSEIHTLLATLNGMEIETVRVVSDDIDLTVGLGADRQWLGVSGHNIPSFEVFTTPDNRVAEGFIEFDVSKYYSGTKISGIRLEFEDGVCVKASADEGEDVLQEMIAVEGADRIGEFSLTDKRHSNITKFMADTLFDENMGGEFGNTHIALGNGYTSGIKDHRNKSKEGFVAVGVNSSGIHQDFFSTKDRTVTATLQDGSQVVIYKDGMWQV